MTIVLLYGVFSCRCGIIGMHRQACEREMMLFTVEAYRMFLHRDPDDTSLLCAVTYISGHGGQSFHHSLWKNNGKFLNLKILTFDG